jgi:Ca2+-binding RTX toxin-like protein
VDVFVGYTDPNSNALETAAKTNGNLTEADLLAANAVGLFVDNANLGMVIGSAMPVAGAGTLNTAALKFFSLKADANLVALVGVPGVELSGRGVRVEVNSGSKFPIAPNAAVGPAIDWLMSFPDTDGNGNADLPGYEVQTGTMTAPVVLSMDGFIIGGGVENVHIELGEFVYIDGAIYFEMGTVKTVKLADSFLPIGDVVDQLGLDPSLSSLIGATEKEVVFLSIGGKDLQAFFGINGPYWIDADDDGEIDRDGLGQIVDAETNDKAVGLVIDNLTFGLTLATPTNTLDPTRYVALKGSANMIGLVGTEDYITMRAENLIVELNISTPLLGGFPLLPVIDWVDSFGSQGYGVKTGARNPDQSEITVNLTMEELLIKAGIGFMTMDVLGVVSLSGSLGIEIGPSASVTLVNGTQKAVKTLTFGAANVYGFIGYNGPYVHDSNNNGYVDRGDFNTNLDGSLGAPIAVRDGLAGRPKAVGFAINDLDIGIMLMVATDPADAGIYLAAKVDVESFGLVGINGLSATGRFDVQLNVGFGLSGFDPNVSPVDFTRSFSEAPALFSLMDTNNNQILDQAEQEAALAGGYIGSDITTVAQLVAILNASNGPPDDYLTINEVLTKLKDSFKNNNQAAIAALDVDGNGRLNTGYEVFTGDPANPIVLDFDNFLISIQLGGEIQLDGLFRMYGVFLFEVDSSGLKAFVAAGLEIGPDIGVSNNNKIFTMNALGALVINGSGLAADIQVSISIGGALNTILSLNASARLVFNTTGADQTITIPARYAGFLTGTESIVDALPASATYNPAQSAALAGMLAGRFTANADGSLTFTIDRRAPRLGGGFDAPGSYFMVAMNGNLTIASRFVISAAFQLKVSGQGLELGFNGTINLGGFASVAVEGGAVIENGVFAAYAKLAININVSGVKISGGADFEVNSGNSAKTVFDALGNGRLIAANTYMVSVDATINLFDVLTATGNVRIGILNGNFLIDVNATLSFFGILDVGIAGYFNTNGTFSFTGSLSLDLTYEGFGIKGSLSVSISNSGFSGSGSVSLVLFGKNINIASGAVSVNWNTGAWLIRAEGPLSIWLEVSSDGNGGFKIDGGLGFFEDVLEVLGEVADAIAEGVVAAANAIAGALVDLGEAILQFGEDVVEFFKDVGDAIAAAAQAVWNEISSWFEDERTVITQYTINPKDYYRYTATLVGGVLTITNGTAHGYASSLTLWVVNGNLIVDAPDFTKNVLISSSQKQKRNYTWDGWPPYGEWGPWYNVGAPQTQTANINITNASNFAVGSVNKIVIIGTDNAETIILDRNTISIDTDVYANGGDDVISTGKGNDRVWGGAGNDIIFTYEGNDQLYGGDGNDKLFGGLGNDLLDGGAGDDLLDENKDRLNPGTLISETNILIGGSGNDTILGSPGKDTITGGSGDDILLGLANDDTYIFQNGYGTDQFVDYNGFETLDFSAVTVSLQGSMSDTGTTFSAGSGNLLSIDQFAAIKEVNLGLGNDRFNITKLPGFHLHITDAGGADIYDFDFDISDSSQLIASVSIQDNDGSIDRIELDVNSTGFAVYLHPLEVLLNKLHLSFNAGIEQLVLTDHAAATTITTAPNSGLTTLLLKAGVTVASATGGTIELLGRRDFTLLAGAFIQTSGNVIIRGDHDDIDSAGATINLLGTINADQTAVHGGNDNDVVNVGNVTIGTETTIWTYGGTDIINIRTINAETTVHAGLGNDTINVGTVAPATGGILDGINALLSINGGGGTDILNLDDTGDTNANTGTLTPSTVTGLDMGGSISYAAIATLNIGLGTNGDVLTVVGTHAGVTNLNSNAGGDVINIRAIGGVTTVDAGIGSDVINIGSNAAGTIANPNNNSGGTVDGIAALLTIIGNAPASGSDWLYVDDSGDDNPNVGILTSTTITGLDMGGSINYGTVEHLVISLGSGGNTFTINSTHGAATSPYQEETIVNTGSGADMVHINHVSDLLTVNGQAGADVVNVNGTGVGSVTTLNTGAGADTVNVNNVTNLLIVNGGADADTLNVNGTGVGSVTTLNGDAGNDIFNIRGMDGRVNVRGGADNDTVNVTDSGPVLPTGPRTTATGSIDQINALLDIDGGTGTMDVLNIDDSRAAATNHKAGTLTSSTLRGLELDVGIDYLGMEVFKLWLGYGDNVFIVDSTHAGATTISTAQGNDTVHINAASGLVTVNAEQGDDVINVRATLLNSEVRINGHEGRDTINLSNFSPGLPANYPASLPPPAADRVGIIDSIDGLIVIDGGLGLDVVNVDDSGNNAAKAGTLTANTLRGLGLEGGVNYTGLEDFNLWLGTGADVLFIHSTHAGATHVYAGDGNATTNERDDTIGIRSVSGITTIHGQAGNDFFELNVNAPVLPQNASFVGLAPLAGFFTRTHLNGLGGVINLHGEGGSDHYTVHLANEGTALVNVHDNGAPDDGVDTLVINGADVVPGLANNPHDTFLLRRNFVALLNDSADANPDLDQAERVNYDQNINARLIVNGLGGNDAFAADDNSSITTLDGGAGNDRFQIGQVFGTPRDAAANIAAADTFGTTPVIIGVIRDPLTNAIIFNPSVDALTATVTARIWQAIADAGNQALDGIAYVSDGVSYATTVFGGDGADTFSVYHNKGVLRLEGEDGNDEFIVRAFVVLDGTTQAETEVLGGNGDDSIQYAINAPVSIDGGAGFDSVVVLGTPFNDNFVVTSYGIFGAGLNVRFTNVESAELDALEGDDTIYVISTNEKMVTTVIGGLGSDTINIMGDVVERIVSNDLLGRSGLITHGVLTGDAGYLNAGVNGVSTSVISASGGSLVSISPLGNPLRVSEDGLISSYFIMLTGPLAADFSTVYLTVSAGVASSRDRDAGGASLLVSTDGVTFTNAVVLTFNAANAAQQIFIKAINDSSPEGERLAMISHSINSTSESYNRLSIQDVAVLIVDNDKPGIEILQVGPGGLVDGLTEVLEGVSGFGDSYRIRLTTAPAAGETVTITLLHDGQLQLAKTVFTFTLDGPTAWNVFQDVLLLATDDADVDGTKLSSITHVMTSSLAGSAFNLAASEAPVLDVTVYDNETAGVIVRESGGSTVVVDGGLGDSYWIRLTRLPASVVTLSLTTDAQTKLFVGDASRFSIIDESPADGLFQYTLTFNSLNWSNWVEVHVTANPDFVGGGSSTKTFAPSSQNLDQIRGPLIVEGGVVEGKDRSLVAPVVLPGELNPAITQNGPLTDESRQIDRLNIFHADNVDADFGFLTHRGVGSGIVNTGHALTGLGMGGNLTVNEGTESQPIFVTYGGGITYKGFEIFELLLGSGDENLTVSSTADGAITLLHGGGGSDTITVTGRGRGPLVIYGDTSPDGLRYSNTTGGASIHGSSFSNAAGDFIDASALGALNDGYAGVVIYGGAGADRIIGSQGSDHLAGGAGADFIKGEGGDDHIYGDGHFNIDPLLYARDQISRFNALVPSELEQINRIFQVLLSADAYGDTLHGDGGNDIILGDHGIITQAPGTRRLENSGSVVRIETAVENSGGVDTITGGAGHDIIFGGHMGDFIEGNGGDDIIFGDHGFVDYISLDGDFGDIDVISSSSTTAYGGADKISGGEGDDIIIGGRFGDEIHASGGNNIIFGDSGIITAAVSDSARRGGAPLTLISIGRIETTAYADGGADDITTGGGMDIILGGISGNAANGDAGLPDVIRSGAGTDIVFGDHGKLVYDSDAAGDPSTLDLVTTTQPLIGGADHIYGGGGNDFLFGGTGSDLIYGDRLAELIPDVVDAFTDSDLIFGDHGELRGIINPAHIGMASPSFVYTSIHTGAGDGGAADVIYGGSGAGPLLGDFGRNIIVGGQGGDTIYGGSGDDDIIGGHNVAGGSDAGDFIDGGAGNDVIAGDNASIIRTGSNVGPRFGVLTGSTIYDAEGLALVNATVRGANPSGVEARLVTLFDHDNSGNNVGKFGNDVIAGGADDDEIFGQLGDDILHGDGQLVQGPSGLVLAPLLVTVAGSDIGGDDYIEGNGGNDLIYGGLGQDDLVGGSSSFYNLLLPSQRPDGSDTIFGGNGDMISRNHLGVGVLNEAGTANVTLGELHARDSDMILGDNGNIHRLVGTASVDRGSLLVFGYDNYSSTRKIVVRAATLLDYTPGGPDYNPAKAATDKGAADFIHGESGDDFIYGMVGNDILYGDAQDDDIIGGYGHDWISGGTGQDGVLGDDGRLFTSRNGTAEPLFGIGSLVGQLNLAISTPGNVQQAIINVSGALKKTADLTPFNPVAGGHELSVPKYADDIIYGGWGDDFLHGGAGDDAISGAEALPEYFNNPFNPGNVLRYSPVTGEFAEYDEFHPRKKIFYQGSPHFADGAEFILNFDHTEGLQIGTVWSDGNDVIFGGLGNDWLVGGTGRDNLYGGWGDDLLNVDDDHSTNGGLNDKPDTHASYEDRAFGGAGRDRLIGNTGGDRLIDWAGEFNSYIVPFAPFGLGTVSRALQPQIADFLYALSRSDGADPTRGSDARNGEPYGELGLVRQQDFAWRDQTGAPDDPQPGNIPGGARDVLRSATFDSGSLSGLFVDSGYWQSSGGVLQVTAQSLGGDAVAVYHVGDQLPGYFEIMASVTAMKPTSGWKANSYIIFDYQSETDFKFAGLDVSLNKLVMGHRNASGWHIDVQASIKGGVRADTTYNLLLAVNGLNATLILDNKDVFSHTYKARVVDGYAYGLNWGMVGVGSNNARGSFDNIRIQVLPTQVTFDATERFSGTPTLAFKNEANGIWDVFDGRYTVTTNNFTATSMLDFRSGALNFNSYLELSTLVGTQGRAGLIFDRYGAESFKFAAIDVASQQLVIGHYTSKSGWIKDAAVSVVLNPAQQYTLGLTLNGSTVSATLNGNGAGGHLAAVGFVFNAATVDGGFGLLASGGVAVFDDVRVKTNDPNIVVGQGSWQQTDGGDVAPTDGSAFHVGMNAGATSPAGQILLEGGFKRFADAAMPVTGSLDLGDGRILPLEVLLIPLGDTNLDGLVNQMDLYNVWRNIGKDPGSVKTSSPDLDGDGDIDQDDLDIVKNNFLVDSSTLGVGEHRFIYRAPAAELQAGSTYQVTVTLEDGLVTTHHHFGVLVDQTGTRVTVTPLTQLNEVFFAAAAESTVAEPDLKDTSESLVSSPGLPHATGAVMSAKNFIFDLNRHRVTWTLGSSTLWGNEFRPRLSLSPGDVNGDGVVDSRDTLEFDPSLMVAPWIFTDLSGGSSAEITDSDLVLGNVEL